MRTSFPQSERTKKAAEPGVRPSETADYLDLCQRQYPEARRVAVLSLIPGLGQLRNGEMAKGYLFLTITAVNVVFLVCCTLSTQVASALTSASTALGRQPNWDLASSFQHAAFNGPAAWIYGLLLVSFVGFAIRDAHDRRTDMLRHEHRLPKFNFSLPEAASGSYLAHFAVIVSFVLLVVCFIAPMPPHEQVTIIELMKQEPPKQPNKPKPPEPKREIPKPQPVVEKPKPVVVQPRVVKVEAPKPTPVAVAVPTKEPSPLTTADVPVPVAAAPTPAPAAAAPAGGGGGNTGGPGDGGGGGGGDIDMGPYMKELQRKIKKNWFPPKGPESKRIKVSFKLHKDGTIGRLKLVTSSGLAVEDDAATQAVENAAPFAPLPDGAGDEVDINFTFDYNVFNAGRSFR